MSVEKRFILRAHLNNSFGDASEHGEIAANVRLNIVGGDPAAEDQASDITRHIESYEASFDDRIDRDHFPAAPANAEQGAHQPRVVAGWVAADDKHTVRVFQVFKFNRAVPLPVTLARPTPLAWWQ